MKSFCFHLIFVCFLLSGLSSKAESLTRESIVAAKNLGVLVSDFDPISTDDLNSIQQMIQNENLDSVVLLPIKSSTTRMLSPLMSRLEMLALATKGNSKLLVPLELDDETTILKQIQSLNRSVKILDASVMAAHQSTARKFLAEHPDLYFNSETFVRTPGVHGVFPDAIETYISQHGMYLESFEQQGMVGPNWKGRIVNRFAQILDSVGLTPHLKMLLARIFGNQSMTKMELNGVSFDIEYLASGTSADAYRVKSDGESYVLKIANSLSHAKDELQTASRIQRWAVGNGKIIGPEWIDSSESWSLSRFLPGLSLQKDILKNGGIRPELKPALKKLWSDVLDIHHHSGYSFDLDPDNIIIVNDQPYLVDFGRTNLPIHLTFEVTEAVWENYALKSNRSFISIVCRKLLGGR